ncbi:vWA domain-containing protein [Dulcicalothrix desertica]|uniref:vWA domain-containing protein n=1 Tax=Dulcicalothrix desertica TaxID=32056 RepID=UPI000F8DE041|nr:vWA domain-containing protein [Dulcicalothrix desertica]
MTNSSTPKHKLALFILSLLLLPFPVSANTVQISRYTTQNNRVTLRAKVLDQDNIPIQGLTRQNFQIQTTNEQGNVINPEDIKFDLLPPERQLHPDPVYLTILLDMSGSMRRQDAAKNQKLSGAVSAINKFIDTASQQNIPIKLALVPFGYRGQGQCNYLYEVDEKTIASQSPFLDIRDNALKKQLQDLSNVPTCASTNLYDPLRIATSYLRKTYTDSISQIDENPIKPRLSLILLSDGYDGASQEKFKSLQTTLGQTLQITIHTYAYGESLQQLRDRSSCDKVISNEELNTELLSKHCKLPNEDIREYIIDEPILQNLASSTGGIYKLSANADEVSKSLTNFLTTLREYEIVYRQPGADRATNHTTKLKVNSPTLGLNITSQPVNIRMSNFAYASLILTQRLHILLFTTLLGITGVIIFTQWSKHLKHQI